MRVEVHANVPVTLDDAMADDGPVAPFVVGERIGPLTITGVLLEAVGHRFDTDQGEAVCVKPIPVAWDVTATTAGIRVPAGRNPAMLAAQALFDCPPDRGSLLFSGTWRIDLESEDGYDG